MNLLADQCCHSGLVAGLRQDGHDVWYVKESARGAEDDVILRIAVEQQRILLTEDKDFGEMVVRLNLPACGILLLRLRTPEIEIKLTRLREVLQEKAGQLAGSLVVVTEDKIRFRLLSSSSTPSP